MNWKDLIKAPVRELGFIYGLRQEQKTFETQQNLSNLILLNLSN